MKSVSYLLPSPAKKTCCARGIFRHMKIYDIQFVLDNAESWKWEWSSG